MCLCVLVYVSVCVSGSVCVSVRVCNHSQVGEHWPGNHKVPSFMFANTQFLLLFP